MICVKGFKRGEDFLDIALTPARRGRDGALILQRQRRAILQQIKMAGIGAKDARHAAGHGFHRDQIGAAFAAIGK